jgi:hypothetical protein
MRVLLWWCNLYCHARLATSASAVMIRCHNPELCLQAHIIGCGARRVGGVAECGDIPSLHHCLPSQCQCVELIAAPPNRAQVRKQMQLAFLHRSSHLSRHRASVSRSRRRIIDCCTVCVSAMFVNQVGCRTEVLPPPVVIDGNPSFFVGQLHRRRLQRL